ncbi:MAG: TRAP transporter substrate-binding protein DctP [Chloroflexi bacterium]|nr:TRAP transporter substrate-binding protein DctP [Chloroflexota bacterium]
MKRKLIIMGLILALTALPLAAACAKAPAPAPAPTVTAPAPTAKPTVSTGKYVFNVAWWDYFLALHQRTWAPGGRFQRMLYENSNGRIQLNLINKMFNTTDILTAVGDGRADLGLAPLAFLEGSYPVFSWAKVSGLFSLDSQVMHAEEFWVNYNPSIQEIMDRNFRKLGAVYVAEPHYTPTAVIFANEPLNSLAALKGKKIRSPGLIGGMALEAWGAKPIQVDWGEVSQSFVSGIIDGVLTTMHDGLADFGLDFVKYVTPIPVGPGWAEYMVMNAKLFDSLPADIQQIIKDTGRQVMLAHFGDSTAQAAQERHDIEALKIQVPEWSPDELKKAIELAKPVEQEWVKMSGSDAEQVLKIAREVIAKYEAFNAFPKK